MLAPIRNAWKKSFNLSRFFQLKVNAWLVRWLPLSLSRRYIAWLGRLYYAVHPQEKDLIRRTISHVCHR